MIGIRLGLQTLQHFSGAGAGNLVVGSAMLSCIQSIRIVRRQVTRLTRLNSAGELLYKSVLRSLSVLRLRFSPTTSPPMSPTATSDSASALSSSTCFFRQSRLSQPAGAGSPYQR